MPPKQGYRRTPLVRTDDDFTRSTPAWFQEWIRWVSERLGDASGGSNSLSGEIEDELEVPTPVLLPDHSRRDPDFMPPLSPAPLDPAASDFHPLADMGALDALTRRISDLESRLAACETSSHRPPQETFPVGQSYHDGTILAN